MPAGFFSQVPVAAHMVMLHRPSPEVLQVYAGKTEFNEEFGPTALVALARSRAEARLERKRRGSLRYHRRHRQWAHSNGCSNQNAIHPLGSFSGAARRGRRLGLSGNRATLVILDDPHQASVDAQREV